MAKVCATCGMALPRDDARFCGICGTLVASHPANAQLEAASQQAMHAPNPSSLASLSSPPLSMRRELHEQMAQQPVTRNAQNGRAEEAPVWMKRLETSGGKSNPGISDEPQQKAPPRDLHVKVWTAKDDADVENIDTVPLETQVQTKLAVSADQYTLAEVETVQLSVASPEAAVNVSPHYQAQPSLSAQNAPTPMQPMRPPVTPILPAFPPMNAPDHVSASTNAQPQGKKRMFRYLSLVGVALLLLGGFWLWYYQPFSVAAITQTQQQFSSDALGISLRYPTGWKAQVDQHASILSLSDSSHTAQFTVQVSRQIPTDVVAYLKQQATHQGMTAIKSEKPLSFAGEIWQQMQGNVSQSGANYIETLLATRH